MKSETSNADKDLIETIIAELTKQKVIGDKKACRGLDSYYKSSTTNIILGPSLSKSNNILNHKLTPQKQLNNGLS